MKSRPLRTFAATSALGLALVGVMLPLRGVVGDVVTTNIYIIAEDEVETEDAYVASSTARVEGTIDGDLVISTGALTIAGTVTGDVFVLSQGTVHVTGDIGGSLRGITREVIIDGSVGDDVAVMAVATRVSGTVGRDVLVFGGSLTVDGEVERDIAGRMLSAVIDGKVGHDIDIAVGGLTLGKSAVVGGDVLYRSGSDADVATTAQVASQFERLPTRGSFGVELVLTIATLLGFFAFLFSGVVLLWMFRSTAPRAVTAIEERPLRAAAIGVAAIIVLPVIVLIFTPTLVGAPIALALLVLLALSLVFAPVPAVTALGSRLLRGRWGLFASFFVGATIWRVGIWLIPLVGFGIYLGALAAGLGGWILAIWGERKETTPVVDLLPRPKVEVAAGEIASPVGWDAPRAPGSSEADDSES
ncbi:MAG: hypothetical protein U9N84_14795 [Actinomycetota bacterium]|nr:hypothetical protein [Actinomycetota bacterium]